MAEGDAFSFKYTPSNDGSTTFTNNTGNTVIITSILNTNSNAGAVRDPEMDAGFRGLIGGDYENNAANPYIFQNASVYLPDGQSLASWTYGGEAVLFEGVETNENAHARAGAVPGNGSVNLSSEGFQNGDILQSCFMGYRVGLQHYNGSNWIGIMSQGLAPNFSIKIDDASDWRIKNTYESDEPCFLTARRP